MNVEVCIQTSHLYNQVINAHLTSLPGSWFSPFVIPAFVKSEVGHVSNSHNINEEWSAFKGEHNPSCGVFDWLKNTRLIGNEM